MKVLVVVDMQNDFVDGSLGSPEARAIVPAVIERVEKFDGMVIATKDTHFSDYPQTQEGRNLPILHCVKGTNGWNLVKNLERALVTPPIEKPTFGSVELGKMLAEYNRVVPITELTVIGLCTDICVISNVLLLKAFLPETKIIVDASCCAGSTPENHVMALSAMRACQICIENER